MKNKNYFLFLVLMSLFFISCNQGNSQLSFKFDETRKAIIDKQEEIRYEKKREQEIEVEIKETEKQSLIKKETEVSLDNNASSKSVNDSTILNKQPQVLTVDNNSREEYAFSKFDINAINKDLCVLHTVMPKYLDDIGAKRDEEANRKVLSDVLDKLREDLKVDYKVTDKSDNSTTLRDD